MCDEPPSMPSGPEGEPAPPVEQRRVPANGHHDGLGSGTTEWLVSVVLPIEASSAAEAVTEFWGFVDRLGPGELPAFVSPLRDELALQAYLLDEPVNLDPEEDD